MRYTTLQTSAAVYWSLLAILGAVVLAGFFAAYHMEHEGHWVTGMSNQIVWGVPHVFAIFLIVAASGALNTASLATVFGKEHYQPLARLSGVIAIALLVGGVLVLVLDLGRPDRLAIALTHYNAKSVFAWNVFLYIGFILVTCTYLWMLFEQRMHRFSKPVGILAFLVRFILTTATGLVFGLLVAREAYDAAIIAPLFIVMSLSLGTAVFLLILVTLEGRGMCIIGGDVNLRISRLLSVFVVAGLYMTFIYHLANAYAPQHLGIEKFLLFGSHIYSKMFWVAYVIVGAIVPIALLLSPIARSAVIMVLASLFVVVGGFAQLYVMIIGAQAYPLQLFPGMEESSSFFDGVVSHYQPAAPEMVLGVGGIAITLLIILVAIRVLPFLPAEPADT